MRRRESQGLHKFFLQLTQQTFHELGLADPEVVNYLAGVLAGFAHADRLYQLRSVLGARLDNIVDILAMWHQQDRPGDPLLRQRALRQYVGDYALFMSGLFRSAVEQRGVLDLYLTQGRDSYWKVSELDLAMYNTGFLLFQDLSKKFEYYSGALDYMRKTHFAPSPRQNQIAHFLKQLERLIGSGISSN